MNSRINNKIIKFLENNTHNIYVNFNNIKKNNTHYKSLLEHSLNFYLINYFPSIGISSEPEREIEKIMDDGDYIYAVVDGIKYEPNNILMNDSNNYNILMPNSLYYQHGWNENSISNLKSVYKAFLLNQYIFENVEITDPVTGDIVTRPNSGIFKKYRIIDFYYDVSNYSIGEPGNIHNNSNYKSELLFNIIIEVEDQQGHVFKISTYRDLIFLPEQILRYIIEKQTKQNIKSKQDNNTINLLKAIQNNKKLNNHTLEQIFDYLQRGNKPFKNLYTNTKSKHYRKTNRKPNRKIKSSQLKNIITRSNTKKQRK